MNRYKCHKVVRAARIELINPFYIVGAMTPHGAGLHLEGGKVRGVNQSWLDRAKPHVGGYYVQYEDGYTSFSPAAAFESGYTLEGAETYTPSQLATIARKTVLPDDPKQCAAILALVQALE